MICEACGKDCVEYHNVTENGDPITLCEGCVNYCDACDQPTGNSGPDECICDDCHVKTWAKQGLDYWTGKPLCPKP